VTLVAVSVDPPEDSKRLVDSLDLGFPVLSDTDRTASKAWGVEDVESSIARPAVFLVAGDGTIAWRWLSESYKVRESSVNILRAVDRRSGFPTEAPR